MKITVADVICKEADLRNRLYTINKNVKENDGEFINDKEKEEFKRIVSDLSRIDCIVDRMACSGKYSYTLKDPDDISIFS